MNVILKLALQYLQNNPKVVEQLIEQLLLAAIKALKDHNASLGVA